MAISCSPSDLAQAAKSFKGLSSGQLQWIDTYLLAVIAGGSTDPETLAEAAKCYQCIPQGMLRRVQAYLLCQIASGGSGPPVDCPQDMQIAWTPTNLSIGDLIYYQALDGLGTATSFVYSGTTMMGLSIAASPSLASISFPNLTGIDPGDLESWDNQFNANPVLVSFSAPNLTYVSGLLGLTGNTQLSSINLSSVQTVSFGSFSITNCAITSLDLHSLVTAGEGLSISNCAALVSVDISSLVPTNAHVYDLSANALDATTVNLLLARAVANAAYTAGSINLQGGTNAAPTGQGIIDKATLEGRAGPITVLTN